MKNNRPINLDLTTIRFPITAIVSILHRVSGVFVFLMLPLFLWVLQQSLFSEEGFLDLQDTLSSPVIKFFLWVVLSALFYHLIAGIRHLLMDMGWGEEKYSGKIFAKITLILSIICSILIGVWLW